MLPDWPEPLGTYIAWVLVPIGIAACVIALAETIVSRWRLRRERRARRPK